MMRTSYISWSSLVIVELKNCFPMTLVTFPHADEIFDENEKYGGPPLEGEGKTLIISAIPLVDRVFLFCPLVR